MSGRGRWTTSALLGALALLWTTAFACATTTRVKVPVLTQDRQPLIKLNIAEAHASALVDQGEGSAS